MHRTTLSICGAAALAACGDLVRPPVGDPSGAYSYLARIGIAPVVQGTLTLVVAADSSVTGTWELARVPGSDTTIAVGPQLGRGTLRGQLAPTGVWVDLNPGWADNNVFLSLLANASDRLSGTWDHSTLLGSVSRGPVQLRRLQR